MALDNVIELSSKHTDKVVQQYATVFGGAPWYELLKCEACGIEYGDPKDDLVKLAEPGSTCDKNKECGKPLKLVSYYNGEDKLGKRIYEEALSEKDFIGFAGVKANELVGFCWGYAVPKTDTASVWFTKVSEILKQKSIDAEKTFYAAEVGTPEAYRGQGIASTLVEARLRKAKAKGFENAIFRTMNPDLIKIWLKLFKMDKVDPAFDDPNPLKSGKWYYFDLSKLE